MLNRNHVDERQEWQVGVILNRPIVDLFDVERSKWRTDSSQVMARTGTLQQLLMTASCLGQGQRRETCRYVIDEEVVVKSKDEE